MKTIALTRQQFAFVDDSDFEFLNQWKWFADYNKKTKSFYASRTEEKNGKKYTVRMHRFLMNITDKSIVVDHSNHNTLDNTRLNLRVCNYTQNGCNKTSRPNSSSKYLGVTFYTRKQKWAAAVTYNRKKYFVGYFSSEIDAAKARDKKAIEVQGEYANLNFPIDQKTNPLKAA